MEAETMASDRAPECEDMAKTRSLWDRAQAVFALALDRAPAERGLFVAQACGGDTELLEEVESLLAHDIGVTRDMGEDRLEGVFRFAAAALIDEGSLIGKRVGSYRIEAELGHGGMGTVYLAVRADDEFRKKVAIKVVKWGMDTKAMLERFRYERQILAGLDHPYIARLMDGGSTEDRQPFFVMEYAEGRAIDRYCREAGLTIPEICRLFLRVCEAVAYAHRNLVVHRDLKPSNIMVTADGAPKLLDFGVAKLLGTDAASEEAVTNIFQRPLTPEYASPEQVRGLSVSTATDVYSLGAVLYELLTGSRLHSVTSNTAAEWERAVCETEIPRPSLKRRGLSGDLDNILLMALRKEPERRYSSVEQLAGDVRRYLEGLPILARQDSFRYRAGKYIRRNRVSIGAATLVAASLLVGTMLALAEAREARAERKVAEHERMLAEERSRQAEASRLVSDREHGIAEQQRAIADREAGLARNEQDRAQRRLGQMVVLANKTLFDVHRAIERLPGATAARREIVKATISYLESLEKEAGDDPRLRIALAAGYLRIGQVQGAPNSPSLGDTAGAVVSLDRAAAWIKPLLAAGQPNEGVLSVWVDIQTARGEILSARGNNAEAEKVERSVLPAAARLSKISPLDGREANLHGELLVALQYEHPAEAIDEARLAVEGFSKLLAQDPDDADTVLALSAAQSTWGSVLRASNPGAALEHYRESARLREALIAKHPDHSRAQRALMLVYGQIASVMGDSFMLTRATDVAGARAYYEKAAVIARQLAQADPVNRVAQYDLASVELRLGALAPEPGHEAESLAGLIKARGMFEALVKEDPLPVRYRGPLALAHEYIGNRLRDSGKTDEALAEYRESLAIAEKALKDNPRDMSSSNGAQAVEQEIANVLAALGDRAGAREYAERAVARSERIWRALGTVNTRMRLAMAYDCLAGVRKQLGEWAEARGAAVRAAEEWRQVIAGNPQSAHAWELANAEKLIAECDAHLR
jgi:tetratricopeptide (TPR) repeat protein/tRNA A-37 threonylcarbamoyl transferase component Bud32